MNILKKNRLFIIILIINSMISFNLISECYQIENTNYMLLFLETLLCILVFFVFNFIFKETIQRAFFIIISFEVVLVFLFFTGKAVKLYYNYSDKVRILSQKVNDHCVTQFNEFSVFFIIFIPIMVFLLLFLANRGFINSVFIYFNSVVILFWSLGFHRAIEENMFKILLISIITYGANNCISTLKKLNVNFKVNSAKICFYALLPSLLISQISLMLPYDGKYDKSVKEKFVSNYNDINKLDLDKTSFGLQLSGYCDSKKKLGGPININDDLVLKVKSEKPIYLRGNVKDNYNGSMWIKIDDSHRKQLSKLGDVYNPESSVFKPSYDSRTLEIFPQQAKISTIFAPMYTYSIIMDGNIFYDDIPTFVGEVSKNKKYYVSYYYNEEEEYFENCKNVNCLNENTNLEEAQSSYSLYNNYLQIPNTITDRTKDLLRKITEGSKTSYEKISKIKQYLQTYYPYSMNVSVVPDNRDFIDYFLFSEKKGYCVYFATAATMLCRLEGIPARYVEGFKMSNYKDSTGLYQVTNKEAHAWCEVLIDPEKGLWSILETTPSYTSVPVGNMSAQNSYTGNGVQKNKNTSIMKKNDKDTKNVNKNIYKKNHKETNKNNSEKCNRIVIVFSGGLVLILGKVLYVILHVKKILNQRSIIPLYRYSTKRIKRMYIIKPEYITDLEYSETINDEDLKNLYNEVTKAAYEEFYGKKLSVKFDKRKYYKELENCIRMNENIIFYCIKKYLYF